MFFETKVAGFRRRWEWVLEPSSFTEMLRCVSRLRGATGPWHARSVGHVAALRHDWTRTEAWDGRNANFGWFLRWIIKLLVICMWVLFVYDGVFFLPLRGGVCRPVFNGAPEVKTAVPWNLGDPSLVAIYSTTFVEVAWRDIVNRDSTNHTAQVSRPGCGSGFFVGIYFG